MTRDERVGELVQVRSTPLVMISCACNGGRRVGHSSAQHDIGSMVERLDDAPCPEVALRVDGSEFPFR